jgi:hypothetical protein
MVVNIRYFGVFLFIISLTSILTVFILFQSIVDENALVKESAIAYKAQKSFALSNPQPYERQTERDISRAVLCNLPENKSIQCLEKKGKLFLPFDFIARKFDVNFSKLFSA